jgi:hypothetical protein
MRKEATEDRRATGTDALRSTTVRLYCAALFVERLALARALARAARGGARALARSRCGARRHGARAAAGARGARRRGLPASSSLARVRVCSHKKKLTPRNGFVSAEETNRNAMEYRMWPRAPRGRTRTGCWSLALDVQQAIGAANMRFCLVALLCLWSVFSTFLALLCVRAFFFCTREPIRASSSFSKVVAVDSRPEELCCSMCADPLPSKPVPRAYMSSKRAGSRHLHVVGEAKARLWDRWSILRLSAGSFKGVVYVYETEGVGWPCVLVRGDPWLFDSCQLRASGAYSVMCAKDARVTLRRCGVGGMGGGARQAISSVIGMDSSWCLIQQCRASSRAPSATTIMRLLWPGGRLAMPKCRSDSALCMGGYGTRSICLAITDSLSLL